MTIDDLNSTAQTERAAALAAGRSHEDEGRVVEAIEQYDRAQRISPDPELAADILRLRHEAMRAGSFPEGSPDWPPRVADPFPETAAPPELAPADLSSETLGGAIVHHGCVIVRGLLPTDDASALREQSARSIAARDRAEDGAAAPGDDAWFRPFRPAIDRPALVRKWQRDAGGMLMADAPMIMWQLIDVIACTGVRDAIAGYFQEPPALSFRKCVLRHVQEAFPSWHQDGHFMGPDVRTVDVWIALSDCGEGTAAPGIDIVSRRIDEILPVGTDSAAMFPSVIGPRLVETVAGDGGIASPRFAAGDAILFDDRFVHRSSVGDHYTQDRFAIEMWFFAPSSIPDQYGAILA